MACFFKKIFETNRGILLILLFGILISGCSKISIENITYNKEAQLYEYPVNRHKSIKLRNENGELVDNSNYDDFIVELLDKKRRYPYEKRLEVAETLKESDYKIAGLYSESAKKTNKKEYIKAASEIDSIRKLYPKSVLYSDVAFWDGYAREKAGDR